MFRHGEFNPTTILAIVIAVSFIVHLPLVGGLVSWRDRGWRKSCFFVCLAAWLVLAAAVTVAFKGILAGA